MITTLPIANGFYQSQSLPVSAQNCINWYPHINEAPALNQEVLFGTPGIEEETITGYTAASAIRGSHSFRGAVYFVAGTTLYRLTTARVATSLGTVAGTGLVSMADNGIQLMALSGGLGYIFNEDTDVFAAISDLDFTANGTPLAVCFVDGYFVCTTDENGKFIVSSLNDGLAWNALDFATAESSPDGAMVPVVSKNQLFIVGTNTSEQYSNVGGSGFPFQRTGLFIAKGASALFSVIAYNDTFAFVGGGKDELPAIWAVEGNGEVKISTSAIDLLLQQLTDDELAAVFAWTYTQAGHLFVGFGLPTTAIVYDVATGRWHERQSRIQSGIFFNTETYRVGSFVQLGNDLLAMDSEDGRIGRVSLDVYTEYGTDISRTFTTQPMQNNMQPFFIPKLELTMESGVGLIAGETDPSIGLQISRDGGKTWGDSRQRPLGAMGNYNSRAVWRRNGRSSRFDVYRFTMCSCVKAVAIQLTAQIEGGDDGIIAAA